MLYNSARIFGHVVFSSTPHWALLTVTVKLTPSPVMATSARTFIFVVGGSCLASAFLLK
jgi:hypothetical protein